MSVFGTWYTIHMIRTIKQFICAHVKHILVNEESLGKKQIWFSKILQCIPPNYCSEVASSVTNVLRPVYCTIYLAVWGHHPPCWPHINMFIESKWCRGNVMLHIIYLSFILGNGSFWVFIRPIKATFYLYDYFYIIWSNHSLTNFGPRNWFAELLIYLQ